MNQLVLRLGQVRIFVPATHRDNPCEAWLNLLPLKQCMLYSRHCTHQALTGVCCMALISLCTLLYPSWRPCCSVAMLVQMGAKLAAEPGYSGYTWPQPHTPSPPKAVINSAPSVLLKLLLLELLLLELLSPLLLPELPVKSSAASNSKALPCISSVMSRSSIGCPWWVLCKGSTRQASRM